MRRIHFPRPRRIILTIQIFNGRSGGAGCRNYRITTACITFITCYLTSLGRLIAIRILPATARTGRFRDVITGMLRIEFPMPCRVVLARTRRSDRGRRHRQISTLQSINKFKRHCIINLHSIQRSLLTKRMPRTMQSIMLNNHTLRTALITIKRRLTIRIHSIAIHHTRSNLRHILTAIIVQRPHRHALQGCHQLKVRILTKHRTRPTFVRNDLVLRAHNIQH
mmetsp:Transcript_14767/g.22938  ORF Transcript_14767/g.22938 Transcript_14767/m.22938 type:complete len:223 (+) Transcript_14767:365-1033(+)